MNVEAGFIEIPSELMPESEDLPGGLKEIAEVIGVASTIKLSMAFRGRSIYISNADFLIRKKRDIEICNAHDDGITVVQLSRKYNLSTRQIKRILLNPEQS